MEQKAKKGVDGKTVKFYSDSPCTVWKKQKT